MINFGDPFLGVAGLVIFVWVGIVEVTGVMGGTDCMECWYIGIWD